MLIRVNKNTGTQKPDVRYSALASGTVDNVWYSDEIASSTAPKRRNRIRLTQDKALLIQAPRVDKLPASV